MDTKVISVIEAADILQRLKAENYQGIMHIETFLRGEDPQGMPWGTSERRPMTCRLGVKKYEKGGGEAYDPAKYALLFVCDLDLCNKVGQLDRNGKVIKSPYRSINLNGIISMTIKGTKYLIKENQPA